MKYISTLFIACGPLFAIAALWSGSVDEGFKVFATGLILLFCGAAMKIGNM